ncbi:unnamed protein product [Caenorhabditis bovis]|uniref:tRNA (uracil(54)-C(5))-methyltransferase n=1 Tax=Caenorhabditis bovis TaxID=2654633 RepID=A0A8S1EB45_9PELO|nr:unnamed protein product [Caenorhabditis bovis]
MDENVAENATDKVDATTMKKDDEKLDDDRVHIKNIPPFLGFKQFKKTLEKILKEIKPKKLRHMKDYAYVTFETPDEAQQAIEAVNGYEIKKFVLSAELAATEVKDFRFDNPKTTKEVVTPLSEVPYENQLEIKTQQSIKTVEKLYRQLRDVKIQNIGKIAEFKQKLQNIIPAPKICGYRNKCEFTIGNNMNGEITVGFVGGRFSKNQHYVIPLENVDIISKQMYAIVQDVQDLVKNSDLEPFNEFERKGFWRMLTIREFGGDVMLIFTVFPAENENDKNAEDEIKTRIASRYLNNSTFIEKKFRVVSVYWQQMIHCSDPIKYELIGGAPYIYESLLNCRFRVSPSAFFQTNSRTASVLYRKIGEFCELAENVDNPTENTEHLKIPPVAEGESEEVEPKRIKLDGGESEEKPFDYGTVLLDICCGTGTIGQCVLKSLGNSKKICCVGIEMISEAVEDAKQNSKQNKLDGICKYIAGKAEDVFRSMKYHLPVGFDLRKSRVVGVLDPPRAGMHEKVILACREMETMKRLIFVSCDPNAAMKNIVDLCRPTSNKFVGVAFTVTKIQPVDMFPMTNHFEWIIQLDR